MLYVSQLFIWNGGWDLNPRWRLGSITLLLVNLTIHIFYRAAVLPLDDHRIRARGETRTHDHGFNRPKRYLLYASFASHIMYVLYPTELPWHMYVGFTRIALERRTVTLIQHRSYIHSEGRGVQSTLVRKRGLEPLTHGFHLTLLCVSFS